VYEDFKMVTNETTPESLRAMSKGRPKSQLWPNVIEKDIQIPMCDGTLSHARVYSPESAGVERRPLLVMAFGGGYVVGNLESEENNCRSWAKNHGGVAVSISYRYVSYISIHGSITVDKFRLAPENPWPIPHKDIYDGVKWIAANYKDLGADPSMAFLIGGVSSGATTMCTISHLWRDEGLKPPLTGLYLSVPNLCIISALPEKYREKENSWEQNKDAPIFNREVSNFLASE
jgi:acetyl esterase/lipase